MLGRDHVPLAEQLFAEPNGHSGVAGLKQLHLVPANRDASFGAAALHGVGKRALLAPVLERTRRDVKPCGDLCIGALQPTQLLQLLHIDLYRFATCTLPRSTRHFRVSSLRPTTLHLPNRQKRGALHNRQQPQSCIAGIRVNFLEGIVVLTLVNFV